MSRLPQLNTETRKLVAVVGSKHYYRASYREEQRVINAGLIPRHQYQLNQYYTLGVYPRHGGATAVAMYNGRQIDASRLIKKLKEQDNAGGIAK